MKLILLPCMLSPSYLRPFLNFTFPSAEKPFASCILTPCYLPACHVLASAPHAIDLLLPSSPLASVLHDLLRVAPNIVPLIVGLWCLSLASLATPS